MDSVDLEVLRRSVEWLDAGKRVLLVTVVKTWGSSPRSPGALLAVREDGQVVGSVSGGCIEDDIVECNFHRGAFNIRTGEAVSPPCMVPVRIYAIVVLQDSIYIDPHRPRSS